MPTYQYACTECEHAFDQFQSFSDDALTACPECSGKLRKLFNAVGVVFKGSGFYRTDSRGMNTGSETPANEKSTSEKSTSAPAAASTPSSDSSSSTSSSAGSSAGSSSSSSTKSTATPAAAAS